MTQPNMSFTGKLKDQLRTARNKNPWLLLLWNELLRFRGRRELASYSDSEAIQRLYHAKVGRYADLEQPTLFSEKLQWLKLYYRDPLMAQCADKYEVRRFIEGKGYADTLNELIATYDRVEDFDLDRLPERFVLKATHGSAWNIICKDKEKIDWLTYRLIMKSWLKHNIFWNGREWVYQELKPRIVCEKYLEDASGQLLDYKIFCFNGEPAFVQVNLGRNEQRHVQNFYDLNWQILPFGKDIAPSPDVEIPRPASLERMLVIAKDLATTFPFVRVDFYDVQGRVIFGELTFFPASGMPDFVPQSYDAIVGKMLTLPSKNH